MEVVIKRPEVLASTYRFTCHCCGSVVRRGDNYVSQGDIPVCLKCGLPARRLRPVNAQKP